MKAIAIILFLSFQVVAFAQNELHKKVADTFRNDFNNGDFEHIYQSFSTEMKKAKTKKYYMEFITRVKKNRGKLLHLELFNYLEKSGKTRGNYDGSFEFGNASIRITNNANGEIIGLYIKNNTLL